MKQNPIEELQSSVAGINYLSNQRYFNDLIFLPTSENDDCTAVLEYQEYGHI